MQVYLKLLSPKKTPRGFTLVELVIAIGIVALMITIPAVAIFNTLKQSRDERRKNDIQQLQSAIEAYHNAKEVYPATLDELIIEGYMQSIPKDPRQATKIPNEPGQTYNYWYEPNVNFTDYRVYTVLEKSPRGTPATEKTFFIADRTGRYPVTLNAIDSGAPLPQATPQPLNTLFPSNTPRP